MSSVVELSEQLHGGGRKGRKLLLFFYFYLFKIIFEK
jgi:hypothetical protein